MACMDRIWRTIAHWKGKQPLPEAVCDELLTLLCLLPLFRTDLRLTASGIVTASDASLLRGAVCRSVAVTPAGCEAAERARLATSRRSGDEVVLLSFFDGIGGGMRAMDMLS